MKQRVPQSAPYRKLNRWKVSQSEPHFLDKDAIIATVKKWIATTDADFYFWLFTKFSK